MKPPESVTHINKRHSSIRTSVLPSIPTHPLISAVRNVFLYTCSATCLPSLLTFGHGICLLSLTRAIFGSIERSRTRKQIIKNGSTRKNATVVSHPGTCLPAALQCSHCSGLPPSNAPSHDQSMELYHHLRTFMAPSNISMVKDGSSWASSSLHVHVPIPV